VMAHAIPPNGSWIDLRFRSLAPLGSIMALYFIAFLGSRIVRTRSELGIGMSQDGIYHWSWFGCCFIPWSAVERIEAVSVKVPRICVVLRGDLHRSGDPEEGFISQLRLFRRNKNLIDPMFLAVNPAVSYDGLRFYHRHPELRVELGREASVERIRADNFAA
ncbi:MAG: hypothetical protein ACRD1T_27510, partial [Acidimicrobiia bacterium]